MRMSYPSSALSNNIYLQRNPESPYSTKIINQEFTLLDKLHSQNNELLSHIKHLSYKNKELNAIIQGKINSYQKAQSSSYLYQTPQKGKSDEDSKKSNTPYTKALINKIYQSQQIEKSKEQQKNNLRFSKQFIRSSQSKKQNRNILQKELQQVKSSNKKKFLGITQESPSKRRIVESIIKQSRESQKIQPLDQKEPDIPIQIEDIAFPSKERESYRQKQKIQCFQAKHHPNNEDVSFRHKTQYNRRVQSKGQLGKEKRSNRPYRMSLNEHQIHPSSYRIKEKTQGRSITFVNKKSNIIYTTPFVQKQQFHTQPNTPPLHRDFSFS